MTKTSLRKDCKTEEGLSCPFCGRIYENEDLFFEHISVDHRYQIEQEGEKLENLAEEHKETLKEWIEQKKYEVLERVAKSNPRMLHEIRLHPEILDKMVQEEIFKMSLLSRMPNKFDLMWTQDPNWDKVAKKVKEVKEEREAKEKEIQDTVREAQWNSKDIEHLSKEDLTLILKRYLESKRTKRRD
jgi:uncharacterized C2H2 Zn-finger protein